MHRYGVLGFSIFFYIFLFRFLLFVVDYRECVRWCLFIGLGVDNVMRAKMGYFFSCLTGRCFVKRGI